jgi:microsomal dipeptidase-like Zn-dependent dipeptidase
MPPLEVADLHSHYPMQFTAPERRKAPHDSVLELFTDNVTDLLHAVLLRVARRLMNDSTPSAGPSVSLYKYREGNVAIAFSVLYSPFDELSASGLRRRPPAADAFNSLLHQLVDVEFEVGHHPQLAIIARTQTDLAAARATGKTAIVHCIEGGFHLGRTPRQIKNNVAVLRRLGVAYVTLAHLLYRRVATNVAAFPMLPDAVFHKLHPQPRSGLTARGRAALEAMVQQRILVDVTHMSEASLRDTFALLDSLDPLRTLPVIASHMACRMGNLEYNLEDGWIHEIHQRGGVMGVILCDHYMHDGLGGSPRTADESFEVICAHIDRIHGVTGSYDAIAIGSDHDGFIKPTLEGFGHPGTLADLAARLELRYGSAVAAKICSENVRRVLATIW